MKSSTIGLLTLTCIILIIASCSSGEKKGQKAFETPNHKGQKVFEHMCRACHIPEGAARGKLSPPLDLVADTYRNKTQNKEAFIAAIQKFLTEPKEENSLMPEILSEYGVMPPMSLSEEQKEAVAEWLYAGKIPAEKGKESHIFQSPRKRGLNLAMQTKAILGKNLMGKLSSEGTLGALDFCSLNAFTLTDSMSQVLKHPIRRLSDKARNPKNKANEQEIAHIEALRKAIEQNQKLPELEVDLGESLLLYYPIMTNTMCLQCHGEPGQDIEGSTYKEILARYPNDQAVGYQSEEIRGLWAVEVKK